MLIEFEQDGTGKGLMVRLFADEFYGAGDVRRRLVEEAYLSPVPPWFQSEKKCAVIRLNPAE